MRPPRQRRHSDADDRQLAPDSGFAYATDPSTPLAGNGRRNEQASGLDDTATATPDRDRKRHRLT